jgi:hypothetical protein
MMYHDTFHALDGLDDASFRRVMRAACEYSETGSIATELGAIEQVVFGILRCKLDADLERYQRRVEAGRKGGLAKASNAKQSLANSSKGYQNVAEASNAKQSLANLPTTTITTTITPTTTTDTTITTGYSSNTCAREDGEEEFPPSVGEVAQYIREKGLNVDAEDFIRRCEAADWKDGQGRPIMNWRIYLTGYALKAMQPQGGRAARMGGMDPRLAALEAMKGGRG